MIPHSRPWLTADDLEAVERVLRSGQIGQGAVASAFEAAMGQRYSWPRPGVVVGSGSAALHLALLALGVGAGDEVVLPTYMCRSALDVVTAAGAHPVLCDVGEGYVVTPASVAPLVGRRTRALIVPHMYGRFVDVDAFRPLGVPIVEDCAQAMGGRDGGRLVGDVGVFSFQPVKCLTTGEGGMAVACDPALHARLRAIAGGATGGRAVFAPMPDTAAALGLSQLRRYDQALARRRLIAERYRAALGEAAAWLLRRTEWARTMHFRFVMSAEGGLDRAAPVFAARGIIVRRGVDALLHRAIGASDRTFPVATELFETTVSVPIYPALADADVDTCAAALGAWARSLAYQSTVM